MVIGYQLKQYINESTKLDTSKYIPLYYLCTYYRGGVTELLNMWPMLNKSSSNECSTRRIRLQN